MFSLPFVKKMANEEHKPVKGLSLGWILTVVFLLSGSIFAFLAWKLQFTVLENDFWGILYYSEHLSWEDTRSLYNGFYPIGYAILLRFFPYGLVIHLAFFANVVLGAILITSVTGLLATFERNSVWLLFTTSALAVAYPLYFQYVLTVGADIGGASFTALAVWLLWKKPFRVVGNDRGKNCRFVCIGLLLGLSTLWRSHFLISAAAILGTFWLSRKPPLVDFWKMVIAFTLMAAVQPVIAILSGHKPLETDQMFNIYKTFVGVNWYHPPTREEITRFSLYALFIRDPDYVLGIYLSHLRPLLSLSVPGMLLWLVSKDGYVKQFAAFSMLTAALYAFPVALGGSPRAPLPISLFYIVNLVLLAKNLGIHLEKWRPSRNWYDYLPIRGGCITRKATSSILAKKNEENLRSSKQKSWTAFSFVVICMLALLTYWVKQDNSFYQSALQRGKVLRRVEYVLLNHGLRSPSEVFTTSFNLYFSFPPYHPRVNGGWDRFSLWGYNQEYPELPVVSLEGFLTACAEQGIRYLVLSPKAGLVADFLRDIYESRDTAELEFLAASGQLRIYQLHIR